MRNALEPSIASVSPELANARGRGAIARAALPVSVAILAVALLGGCTQAVALEPADDAINVGCAEIVVRLPDTVSDLDIRETPHLAEHGVQICFLCHADIQEFHSQKFGF